MEGRDEFVQRQFLKFLEKQSPQCAEVFHSCVDEIVLNYMVSILEDLGTDNSAEDAFDSESFTEMMEAYMPGFAQIDGVQVTEWMFELSAKLSDFEKGGTEDESLKDDQPLNLQPSELSTRLDPPCNRSKVDSNTANTEVPVNNGLFNGVCRQRTSSSRTSSTSETGGRRSRTTSTISVSETDSQNGENIGDAESEGCFEDDDQVKILLEMFPAACTMEIAHCLGVTNGDMELAAQLILHRQEAGETVTEETKSKNNKSVRKKKMSGTNLIGDAEMKKHIIKKYSYVDTEEDKKQHKPIVPKTEPKKMVRYLDGRIVSTRGERFTEIKKDDEEQMKKTFINLKPAKQYRFH